jgi:excinuclease ABC subunit B
LIQTAGRTARNLNGKVLLYADTVTGSMARMMEETGRRRAKQMAFNVEHNIAPQTVYKTVNEVLAATAVADVKASRDARHERLRPAKVAESVIRYLTPEQKQDLIEELRQEMVKASRDLEFERAAQLRDEIRRMEELASGTESGKEKRGR